MLFPEGFPGGSDGKESICNVKNLPAMQETCIQTQRQEDPLEKGTATHSSILAEGIPRDHRRAGHNLGTKQQKTQLGKGSVSSLHCNSLPFLIYQPPQSGFHSKSDRNLVDTAFPEGESMLSTQM